MRQIEWAALDTLSDQTIDSEYIKNMKVGHVWLDMRNRVHRAQATVLLTSYKQRRSKENYTFEQVKRLIDGNRFDGGFFVGTVNDKAMCCFGLTEYKGWYVITRFAKLHTRIPLFVGYGIDEVIQRAQANGKKGVMVTFNRSNDTLCQRVFRLDGHFQRRRQELKTHWMWKRYVEMILSLKRCSHRIVYRGQSQKLLFWPIDGSMPDVKFAASENDSWSSGRSATTEEGLRLLAIQYKYMHEAFDPNINHVWGDKDTSNEIPIK